MSLLVQHRLQPALRASLLVCLLLFLAPAPIAPPAQARASLPPLVFVARSRLATSDYLFPRDLGPAGHMITGMTKFAPGSKLLIRDPSGQLRVLIDTARPAGDPLNPLGLRDVQSPNVSFDARRIVFAGTFGPETFRNQPNGRPYYSWRLFEIGVDGRGLRQLTYSDRDITIPDGPGNAEAYAFYDDLFPAYLADGRIVFSSSRYPARSPYDGRRAFNLYMIDGDGSNMRRLTTERTAALHPAPLPDGSIVFSRWWVNFNQPSERGIYNRIDNRAGTEIARDQSGRPIIVERRIQIVETAQLPQTMPQPTAPPMPTPTPTLSFVEKIDPATGGIVRLTKTPAPLTPTPRTRPTATPTAALQSGTTRMLVVEQPVTGYRLPDGTLVYSNTNATFKPARGRLADGFPIRDAPNTWHLMAIEADGSGMRRFAWTPRYESDLTNDSGLDTYNAVQPAVVLSGGELLVAYTTQRDQTMAHSTLYTGIRVARPGIENMALNTTESIAGYRWDQGTSFRPPYALAPAGLPDGRIIFSQTAAAPVPARTSTYTDTRNGRTITLRLQSSSLRYELRTIYPDGTQNEIVPLEGLSTDYDAVEAKPIVARPVGDGPGMWRLPRGAPPPVSDDPLESNVPFGLLDTFGNPAYTWSRRSIQSVALVAVQNANVYANPPLEFPFINNSPPPGSAAFADIYIDANQFGGATSRAPNPDDQARAVKWLTVPVNPDGSFLASAPADVPMFIVLRDKQGRIVRGGNRHTLSIAQGNIAGRPGQPMFCIGCHMGHASGSIVNPSLAARGWTNIAPAAAIAASSSVESGAPPRINDRRGYVTAPNGTLIDRTPPWTANGGAGQWIRLEWPLPMAILEVRLVGAEPGQEGRSADYAVSGELRFYLRGQEIAGTARTVEAVAPLSRGGTLIRLPQPIAADRIEFTVTAVRGTQRGAPAPAALSEIEVAGQGATPDAFGRGR
ncbi:MAG: hypothetical protein NZ699_08975 [Roseiflexus sp.]|nr:hypothetical protein [Roseiflexus sp.]MCS7289248.1 hypothetical protein [Roseiflexus sp.]